MSLVLLDKSDGVGTITLNNPGERNTLTAPMVAEIVAAMNEIEAEIAGTIVHKLAENGRPVEYGEALFAIRPR